jgi:hypothetical protein
MNLKSKKMGNETTKTTDNSGCHFFRASAADFKKIPGSPIAYWVSEKTRNIFDNLPTLEQFVVPKQGLATGDNTRFTRSWHEVSFMDLSFDIKKYEDSIKSNLKWVPYSKGGGYRKWYGFSETVIYWKDGGLEIRGFKDEKGNERSRFRGYDYYFLPAATWGLITSGNFSCRFRDFGYVFDIGGMSAFAESGYSENLVAILNSKFTAVSLKIINPTLNYQIGDISRLPLIKHFLEDNQVNKLAKKCIDNSRSDWNSYETSWDFISLPLLHPDYHQSILKATYINLRAHWREMLLEMHRLEQENNRIFIDAYGLQDELTPEVPLNEITLTCNPHYRYGNNKKEEELETLLLADTMKEFISFSAGCMFGRYSLDKPGLILANQGETTEDYYKKIKTTEYTENTEKDNSNNSVSSVYSVVKNVFPPDDDNVIPMLDGDWFTDDITERFCKFLKVTFGEEHYEENLTFIEKALGKDIRKYFLKDFYNDHLKRYKKRPIYWLFSSPKGTFNALIYMHRYRPDTVSVVLNDYLREFRTKLSARKNHLEAVSISASASPGEKTKALKEIESIKKMIDELDTYEREVVYPLATEQVEIDLDDGVKVNYQKFGGALKKIPGLAAKNEE